METILQQLNLTRLNDGGCIGGDKWVAGSAKTLDSLNPSTGESLAAVKLIGTEDYEQIILAAQKASLTWRKVPAPKRGELVRLMGEALRVNKDALGSLVALEMGKSKVEGDGEVQEMIDIADFAVGQSRMLYGKTMHSERPTHRMYEQWHPIGIVGIISAFNFPVAVWAWNAFIAAICGNSVVWKPSRQTPLCAVAVQHICNAVLKAHNYPPIFSLFISERDIAEQFIQDERVALVSFTGSTPAGRHVAEVVSKRFGKSLLELGGNNAIIVTPSADLTLAIPAIVFGAVGTAGQRCTTTRRLIIHKSLAGTLVHRLVKAYQQVKVGDPLNKQNHMGPLISADAVKEYEKAITEVLALGGKVLSGGHTLDGKGYFVEPTLIEAQGDWPVVQRETFAPILYVITYDTLEEAIALHNGVKQGLSSALFTQDVREAELFLSACGSDCGIANINIGTSGAEIGGAFGGEKETGGGRESGSDAWQAYMRRQTNTINWGNDLPLAQGIEFNL
ncbi:MAG: piperidine-6-carboxylate dehydrogenase [Gammaproteobacteria bacterium]|jgi:aldehyde dehydrogenase (NAD+)|nr:piperidine-6-carboxylate dehydrogenase [Gammaproteobacteria bacterium]